MRPGCAGSFEAVLADLAEVDGRRFHLSKGHPSLLGYCVEVLHLS